MELLDYSAIKSLGITKQACERFTVPQVKTKSGIKYGAVFSEEVVKIINADGSYSWMGDYDPNLGLFGQKACIPGEMAFIVASDLEALKLGSLGYNAVCLAEPKQADSICFSILEETLLTVTDKLAVWTETTFGKRGKALEKFLLHLAGSKRFTISEIDGSNVPILSTKPEDIKAILEPLALKAWKPKGIMTTEEVFASDDFLKAVTGVSCGFPRIDDAIGKIRKAEITLITAGSGIGKSAIMSEVAYHMGVMEKQKMGMLYLEEQAERTVKRLAAIKYDIPLSKLRKNPELLTPKQWDDFRNNKQVKNNFVFLSHFGSLDSDSLFSKIDYMIDFCGCDFIVLDHISIVVSGMSSKEGERKDIDILMTRLATTAVAKNVGFIIISHLSVPDGVAHEEGGRVTLSHLRGSGAIKQLSWTIIAAERNQQDIDSTRMLIRLLKCREEGNTGPIAVLNYETRTGRIRDDLSWNPHEFDEMLHPKRTKGQGMYSPRQPQRGGGFGGISGY